MAKVPFSKFNLKLNKEVKEVQFNDLVFEVKQYLPVQEKLNLIAEVIELSADENNFSNPVKNDAYFVIKMVEYYTNISFTDKQKEDYEKLYDLIASSGLEIAVAAAIPSREMDEVKTGLKLLIKSIYEQKNSVLGILESISQDYSNLDLDATAIQQKLADPENMELLKNVLTKLG